MEGLRGGDSLTTEVARGGVKEVRTTDCDFSSGLTTGADDFSREGGATPELGRGFGVSSLAETASCLGGGETLDRGVGAGEEALAATADLAEADDAGVIVGATPDKSSSALIVGSVGVASFLGLVAGDAAAPAAVVKEALVNRSSFLTAEAWYCVGMGMKGLGTASLPGAGRLRLREEPTVKLRADPEVLLA